LRIGYLNARYRPEPHAGGDVHIQQFVQNALGLGHELWTPAGAHHPGTLRLPAGALSRLRALRRLDALYFRIEWMPPLTCRAALWPFKPVLGSPHIVFEFNAAPEFGTLLGEPEEAIRRSIRRLRRYTSGCDLAVCVSSTLAAYVSQTLGFRRTIVITNGSDPDFFKPSADPKPGVRAPGRLNVAWIGSADVAWHDLDLLVRAASLLLEQCAGHRFMFHVIGQGFAPRTLPHNVVAHGPKPYGEMPAWLAAMDVGLCLHRTPVARHSSPLKLFDYLASGLSVIGTEQPQVREVLSEIGATDLVIPRGDAAELARALLALEANPARRAELGAAGRALVERKYSWRSAVETALRRVEELPGPQRTRRTRSKCQELSASD
jgi:glycosyltransferase involved in cell wall biosynthesis